MSIFFKFLNVRPKMAKSKIAKIVFKKAKDGKLEWQGDKGIYYIVELTFEDGTKGDAFAQSETQFAIGQEHEYTYEPNANPSYNGKIKVVKPKTFGGGNNYPKANPNIAIAIAAVQMANDLYAKGVIPKEMVEPCAKKRLELIKKLSGESAPLPNPQNPQ